MTTRIKTICVAGSLGLVSVASAQQTPAVLEEQILSAYSTLQSDSTISMSLTGYDQVTGTVNRTRSFQSQIFFSTATDPKTGKQTAAKVELDDFDTSGATPVWLHRYVGDGKTLWSYDFTTQRYSATNYYYYTVPADYPGSDAVRMFDVLYSVVKGPSAYMVRLMREINPGSNLLTPRYDSWDFSVTNDPTRLGTDGQPLNNPVTPPTIPPMIDPLTGRAYSDSSGNGNTTTWVLYGETVPNPFRTVAFDLYNGDLQNVYVAEQKGAAGTTKLSNYAIAIYPMGVIPTSAIAPPNNTTDTRDDAYAFIPYRTNVVGWTAVSRANPSYAN